MRAFPSAGSSDAACVVAAMPAAAVGKTSDFRLLARLVAIRVARAAATRVVRSADRAIGVTVAVAIVLAGTARAAGNAAGTEGRARAIGVLGALRAGVVGVAPGRKIRTFGRREAAAAGVRARVADGVGIPWKLGG